MHGGVCVDDVVACMVMLRWGGWGMREVCRWRAMVQGEGCVHEGSGGGRVARCETDDESVVCQVCTEVVPATGQ